MSNGYNQYIGMRYVPIIDGEWSQSKAYEPLVVVVYNGNSYISKTYVPAGTLPTNETYWILAANYNAQVEQYRQEVRQYQQTVEEFDGDITDLQTAVDTINNTELPADRQRLTNLESGLQTQTGRIDTLYNDGYDSWTVAATSYGLTARYKKIFDVNMLFIEGNCSGVIGTNGHSFTVPNITAATHNHQVDEFSSGIHTAVTLYQNTVTITPDQNLSAGHYINVMFIY